VKLRKFFLSFFVFLFVKKKIRERHRLEDVCGLCEADLVGVKRYNDPKTGGTRCKSCRERPTKSEEELIQRCALVTLKKLRKPL
jgi:hypothetical protein